VSNWNGLWAPKGTPQDVILTLNAAVAKIMADPAITQKLLNLTYEIPSPEQQAPEALAKLQKTEIDKWWPIIKAAKISNN
jgi:tripartite-type tricarboxylate transporter receptor subunit TctC